MKISDFTVIIESISFKFLLQFSYNIQYILTSINYDPKNIQVKRIDKNFYHTEYENEI